MCTIKNGHYGCRSRMGIIFLSLLHVISIALYWYMIGLVVYSILCLLQAQEIFKQESIVSKAQTALFIFYDPLLDPIRKNLI